MAQKKHSRTSSTKWELRRKQAVDKRDLILQRRSKIASAFQYAKKNPDILSLGNYWLSSAQLETRQLAVLLTGTASLLD